MGKYVLWKTYSSIPGALGNLNMRLNACIAHSPWFADRSPQLECKATRVGYRIRKWA